MILHLHLNLHLQEHISNNFEYCFICLLATDPKYLLDIDFLILFTTKKYPFSLSIIDLELIVGIFADIQISSSLPDISVNISL